MGTPSGRSGRFLLGLLAGLAFGVVVGVFVPRLWHSDANVSATPTVVGVEDKLAEEHIRKLYDQEHNNLLQMDIAGQERFLPDDFVVTNPFGMFIRKPEVLERLRANIIKYSKYERDYEYFRRYGDTMIVVGSETVVPTPDANRPDAGTTVLRRFTEMWVRRNGTWEKVARHASNLPQQ